MALNEFDLSAYIDPPLCANNNQQVDNIHAVCEKKAAMCCGGCSLVQVRIVHPMRDHLEFSTLANNGVVLLQGVPGCRLAAPQEDVQIGFHDGQVDPGLVTYWSQACVHQPIA
jgi:hypothetical protein